MGTGVKGPRQGLAPAGPAPAADPNPVLLFSVFGGMLMTAAGLLYRLLTRDGLSRVPEQPMPGLLELRDLFDRAQALQNDHSELIFQAGAENDALYPIGAHTMWIIDVFHYRRIRDESVLAFVGISRETLRIMPYPLDPALADQIAWNLKTLQRSLDLSSQASAFREAAFALSGGFEAVTTALHLLSEPDNDDLDDEYMLFA